jgi:hypothetical protein
LDNQLAPIALFVYNRPWHTQQTVEALQKNELAKESELFIYSDEAKNKNTRKSVDEVRNYIETISGFKKVTIIKREKNWGLANSIIHGATEVLNKYEKIIVLEDDLITSPYFLKFMNESLIFYKNEKNILSVTGFSPFNVENYIENYKYSNYFHRRAMSWSWATWSNKWNKVDWEVDDFNVFIKNNILKKDFNSVGDNLVEMLFQQQKGLINSWYVRFTYHGFKNAMLTVYPKYSLIYNNGFDSSGTHTKKGSMDKIIQSKKFDKIKTLDFSSDYRDSETIHEVFNTFFSKTFFGDVKLNVKYLLKGVFFERYF